MILVDSTVWIDFFRGVKSVAAYKLYESLEKEVIITGDIIRVEVLQGFVAESDYHKASEVMDIFPCFSLCSPELAFKATENMYKLRNNDFISYSSNSVIIATFCIENEIPLLHNDPGFKPFERYLGLRTK